MINVLFIGADVGNSNDLSLDVGTLKTFDTYKEFKEYFKMLFDDDLHGVTPLGISERKLFGNIKVLAQRITMRRKSDDMHLSWKTEAVLYVKADKKHVVEFLTDPFFAQLGAAIEGTYD